MLSSLSLLMIIFIIGGSMERRVLYMMLQFEGVMLSSIFILYLSMLPHTWWFLILLVMSVVGAAVGLSIVVQHTRSAGSDYVNSF